MTRIPVRIVVDQPERRCEGCTLCCKLLAIQELQKPVCTWCRHATRGAGCDIYDSRPPSCQDFKCLWLVTDLDPRLRPDRIHGFLATATDGENLVVYEDPGWPGVASEVLRPFISKFIESGRYYVIVVCGEARRLIAREDLMRKVTLRAPADSRLRDLGVIQVEDARK